MANSIDEMWAWIAIGEEGEGITAYLTESGWLPMVGADEPRMTSLRGYAQELVNESGKPLVLARFSQREDLEIIKPQGKPARPIPTVNTLTNTIEETGEKIDPKAYFQKHTGRCEARVRRGTGESFCDRPLNHRGECDRAGDHIEESK
jgi:hypothetical protein